MTDTPHGRPPEVGSTFGPYRIDGVVGVGGMGMVYTATDLRLGRQVAVKVVLGHFADTPEFLQRFQREAAVLARLDSPHVIAIYDHGEHEGWPYLVTQYAAGGDLGRLLRAHGALPPPLAAAVCAQIADALVDAHSVGVIHRDVKPANVLLRDDRLDRLHVYLCDFGVAAVEASGLTTPGSVAGTWNYLAPERAQGTPATPASDVYSVGCLLYETLTGRPPYQGTDVEVAMAHLNAPVPQLPGDDAFTRRINFVLARSMSKDPGQRFGSAAELRDELRAVAGAAPTPLPRAVAGRRRRTGRIAIAAVAAVTAIAAGVVAGLVVWPEDGDDPGPDEPTATSDPQAGTVVTGDVDDNGFGDIAVGSFDEMYELYSTGAAFKATKVQKGISTPVVWGDVDNDGQLDLIEVDGRPPRVTVEVHYPDRSTQAYLFATPEATDDSAIPMSGDFDGDGTSDVAIATQSRSGELTVSTALSEGESGLGTAEPWYTMTGVSADDDIEFVVGDFDGDGVDDLASVLQVVASGTTHLQVLTSSGEAFEEAGEPLSSDDLDYFYGVMRGGDFDGDGVDEIAVINDVANIDVYRWKDGAFSAPEPWHEGDPGDETTTNVSVTDLDGDSDDDLAVVITESSADNSRIRILRSDGEQFGVDDDLQPTVPVTYPDAVDSVNWDY